MVFGRGVVGYRDDVLPQGDISSILEDRMGFPSGSDGKASACNAGDLGSIPGSGISSPLEKEVATHSSTLAWKISWTEETCRLLSMGSQRVGEITKDKLEGVSGDKRTPPVPKKGEHC